MLRALCLAIAALSAGCTFYTSCPNSNDNGNGTPSGGSANAVGGSGNSDNSNLAGSPPTGDWVNATGSLAGKKVGYGNLAYVTANPFKDQLIVGLSEAGLWASEDGAQTFDALGTGKDSVTIPHRTIGIRFDPDRQQVFWVAGTYGPAFFKTTDGGDKFVSLGLENGCEGFSIDFTDPNRKTIVGSVHEMGRIVYLTKDGGDTWTDIGATLPPNTSVCSYPLLLDSKTLLITCSIFNAPDHGIYRSTDLGENWTQVSTISTREAALHASDGTIYWSMDNNGGLTKSTDEGLSWTQVSSSSISVEPMELPDGSVVTSTRDYLIRSVDGGKTWSPVSAKLPYVPIGLAYSTHQKAFFIWHYSVIEGLPADSIMRFDYDYEG